MISGQRFRAKEIHLVLLSRREALWASKHGGGTTDILARLPDSTLFVFAACLICAVAARYYSLFPSVIDPDESLYLVMAQHWLMGELPYKSVWDQHSVGLPAFFAIIQFFFSNSIVAIRLSASAAVALTATTIYFMSRLVDRQYLSSVFAAAFYIAWTARFWGLSANCEIYLNALIAPAMFALLRRPGIRLRSTATLLCFGAFLIGAAWQVKHVIVVETAFFFVGAFVVLSKMARRWSILSAVAACIALPSVVVLCYFYRAGLLAEYFQATVLSNLVYAGSRPSLEEILTRLPRSAIVPIIAIFAAGGAILRRWDGPSAFIFVWAVAACADVALPGQYWAHYFLLILPTASVLVGHLVTLLRRRWSWCTKFPRQSVACLSVLVLLACDPFSVYRDSMHVRAMARNDVPRMVSQRISKKISSNDYLFVFDYQPVVYWLTDGRLPTSHVFPGDWSQKFRSVSAVDPLRELELVFSHRPAFVVVTDKDLLEMGNDVIEKLNRSLSSYDLQFQILDERSMREPVVVKIYHRRS